MKATEVKLLEFLKKSPQFVIPIYQRNYSWSERECSQLWDDILRTGQNEDIAAHFVGSIVYVEKGLYQVSSQTPLLVIDGQQRLTTMMLILEALARQLGEEEPIGGFSSKKIRNYYLINHLEDGDSRYKLVLSQTDKSSLTAILDQRDKPQDHSIRVEENFEFFTNLIQRHADQLAAICKGLAKLVVVDISLDRDQDNPQLIFESLNSTGKELSQADLIRNFILMGLEPKLQSKLFEQYWRPMEKDFGQEGYGKYFDGFMRHYLTVRTGQIPRIREVYDAFKNYSRAGTIPAVEDLVRDIRTFASYYCAIALGKEQDPELKSLFHDIRDLKVDVALPFLLEVYEDYRSEVLTKGEFIEIARMVESYVFRRAVCEIPTNSMNKTFATFTKLLDKTRYLENVQAQFLLLPSYRRFPDDDEFARELQRRDLYNFRNRSYWLRRFENFDRKERVIVDEYTIEHILPQNENLSEAWKTELGEDWKRVHKTYLHTLGNLTLTGYNSEYSDRPFSQKKDMEGGFRDSPLRLNQMLSKGDNWNEEAIKNRAEYLAAQAVSIWKAPELADTVLQNYKPTSKRTEYSITDHPHLEKSPTKELYEALRDQILALDPCITEEFLKLYVAFKAETNFVDVVPQSKRLVLMINLPFPELEDPKGLCRDVTGLGRWGNGDVEVGVSSEEDIPYVKGLIRQAFERQMGSDG